LATLQFGVNSIYADNVPLLLPGNHGTSGNDSLGGGGASIGSGFLFFWGWALPMVEKSGIITVKGHWKNSGAAVFFGRLQKSRQLMVLNS